MTVKNSATDLRASPNTFSLKYIQWLGTKSSSKAPVLFAQYPQAKMNGVKMFGEIGENENQIIGFGKGTICNPIIRWCAAIILQKGNTLFLISLDF